MASYIELRREAFDRAIEEAREYRTEEQAVRRPLRGIEEKVDTYAIMRVITSDGSEIPLFDSSGTPAFLKKKSKGQRGYSNFFIQNLREARVEKSQIVATFGEPFVFFFGEQPRVIQFNGYLLNTLDFNWKAEWWENYDRYLRGTALVENDARLYLYYDDVIMEGYLLSSDTTDSQESRWAVPFTASLIITNYQRVEIVGSDVYPTIGVLNPFDDAPLTSYGRSIGSRKLAIRGKISDNYDEFIGGTTYTNSDLYTDDAAAQVVAAEDVDMRVATYLKTLGFTDADIGKAVNNGGITKPSSDDNPFID